jgi:isoquinoline 1-oxidoreductase beta subunit
MNKWTRRAFIGAGAIAGGGLLLGTGGIVFAPNRLGIIPAGDRPHALTTWLRLTPDNRVTVLVPHCDMGQGASTALAMMAAEEMDADWSTVSVAEAPAEDEYANGHLAQGFALGGPGIGVLRRPLAYVFYEIAEHMPLQVTGGSSSVRATGELGMRVAGASARHVLIEAAAARWGVPADQITAGKSTLTHTATGRRLTFGDVANDAAKLSLPDDPPLKPREQWTIVGRAIPRHDLPPKTNGTAVYGIDVSLPDVLYATLRAAPVFGGTLVDVDPQPAMAQAGVVRVVKLPNAAAVVADSYWSALKAVRVLNPNFSDGGNGAVDTAAMLANFRNDLNTNAGSPDHTAGNGADALQNAARVIEAEYSVPFQAHAPMEPPNATVRIADGTCEVWTGVQDPLSARQVAAKAAGLTVERVTVHNHPIGGAFGRKLPYPSDFLEQAVLIAKETSPRPVKLIWSREEDIAQDFYRTASICRFKAGLDAHGAATVWTAHFIGTAGDEAARFAYEIPNQRIAYNTPKFHIRTGYWRSVDHSQHGFFKESFLDELAAAAGKDPFAFRRDLLPQGSRERAVLELAAEKAGWGSALPAGQGRGIALTKAFGSIVAEVLEVGVTPDGKIRPRRATAVVDCGDLVNPDTARAQVEGGIMFALSAALYGNITIARGAVQETNFDTFRVAHMEDTPRIDVFFVESHAKRGGLGEVGVPGAAAALGNAIFAATGRRLRVLPFVGQDVSAVQRSAEL